MKNTTIDFLMQNLNTYDEDLNPTKIRPDLAERLKGKIWWDDEVAKDLEKAKKKEEKKIVKEMRKVELGECGYKLCSEPALHRCSNCKSIAYCSNACARAEWKDHKRDCFATFYVPPWQSELKK